MEIRYDGLAELDAVAAQILEFGADMKVWQFDGQIGAGKTTLIKAICKRLGVLDNTSSPTFSLVNVYATNSGNEIYHFDFYRIKEEMEAVDIGSEDYFYSGNYCFVEWPEKIPSLLPQQNLKININLDGENKRIISLSRYE